MEKRKQKMVGRLHAGEVVNVVSQQKKQIIQDIECCALKLNYQDFDISKLKHDQADLRNCLDEEQYHRENLSKMVKKYNIDVSNLDAYIDDDMEGAMIQNRKFEKLLIIRHNKTKE